ncbi:7503_t:CDS:10 [Entrophospora sp. SA101]|nr:7503_t:CDS:10 [Entrophospora sp. SA101]
MSTRRKRTSKAISDDESVEYISSSERQSSSRRKTKAKRSRSNTDREEIYDVERMSVDELDESELNDESTVTNDEEYEDLDNDVVEEFARTRLKKKKSAGSAILTAITVCLGGKANFTNRASNLKALIREGASVAQVVLKLRNRGEDAFQKDIYGNSIIIERRITSDGDSRYKIKSDSGKVISQRREDLSIILDYMSIQVDNPINILTQDTARQFLHSSSPQDKYTFFMKGTELYQLKEDYDFVRGSLDTTNEILKRKREILPELFQEVKEVEVKLRDMKKAYELEAVVSSLKNQLAWSFVKEKEEDVAKHEKNLQEAMNRLPSVQDKLELEIHNLEEIESQISELEEKFNAHAETSLPLQNRKVELIALIKNNKVQIQEIRAEKKEINESIKSLKQNAEKLQQKINTEIEKLQENNEKKHEEKLEKIRNAEQEREVQSKRLDEFKIKIEELESKSEQYERKKSLAEQQKQQASEEIGQHELLLNQLNDQKANNMIVYGNSIPAVLRDIDRETRWRKKPIGPLGLYVTLSKPNWSEVLESVIGRTLNAFAVRNYQDRSLLSDILQRHNCASPIIISEDDEYDHTAGEPDERFLTVLRVLQINSPYIKRIFINQNRIECTILVENRREADEIMYNKGRGFPHNVDSCYTIEGYKVGHKGGGFSTQAVRLYRGPSRFIKDVQGQMRNAQTKLNDARRLFTVHRNDLNNISNDLYNVKRELDSLKSEYNTVNRKIKSLDYRITSLREELQEDVPAIISGLEEAKNEALQEIDMYKNQYLQLASKKVTITDEQRPLVSELEQLHDKLLEVSIEADTISKSMEELASKKIGYQNDKSHLQRKLEMEQRKVDAIQTELEKSLKELEDLSTQAQEYCPERAEVTKSSFELDREIQHIQDRLRVRENECGTTIEQVMLEISTKRDAYHQAKSEIDHMDCFSKELGATLKKRLYKWRSFLSFISVQIDDQTLQQRSNDKDPRSLSGGEKSFSVICLLLSLWEAMGCPIRCLDEFDVFMDAVNRRISMRMMIETARESDSTQYILITPQDASSITPSPDVRIHRLHDPERGQRTIDEMA